MAAKLVAEIPFLLQDLGLLESVLVGNELPVEHLEVEQQSIDNDAIECVIDARWQIPSGLWLRNHKICFLDLDCEREQDSEL